mmetsp:Transcript_54185/g.139938  ORF Transcript_54185/g.139938 Transcript_54185/m.139938 type:complete len:379 (-) Transcript_54185:180-1316(-)
MRPTRAALSRSVCQTTKLTDRCHHFVRLAGHLGLDIAAPLAGLTTMMHEGGRRGASVRRSSFSFAPQPSMGLREELVEEDAALVHQRLHLLHLLDEESERAVHPMPTLLLAARLARPARPLRLGLWPVIGLRLAERHVRVDGQLVLEIGRRLRRPEVGHQRVESFRPCRQRRLDPDAVGGGGRRLHGVRGQLIGDLRRADGRQEHQADLRVRGRRLKPFLGSHVAVDAQRLQADDHASLAAPAQAERMARVLGKPRLIGVGDRARVRAVEARRVPVLLVGRIGQQRSEREVRLPVVVEIVHEERQLKAGLGTRRGEVRDEDIGGVGGRRLEAYARLPPPRELRLEVEDDLVAVEQPELAAALVGGGVAPHHEQPHRRR